MLSFALTACQGETATSTPRIPVVRIGERTEDIAGITTAGYPNPLSYSLDGELMVLVDFYDFADIYIYEGATQEYWYEAMAFEFRAKDTTNVAASYDKQHIAEATDDELINIWDTSYLGPQSPPSAEPTLLQTIEAPSTLGLAFSHDGTQLLSLTKNDISIWDWAEATLIHTFDGDFTRMAVSPSEPRFAVAHPEGSISLWAIEAEQPDFSLAGNPGGVRSMAFSPDGRILVSGGNDNAVHLWDTSDGSLIRTLEGHNSAVRQVSLFPGGLALATLGDDALRIWHTESGQLIHSEPSDAAAIRVLAVSPIAPIVYLGYADGKLFAWDLAIVDPTAPTPDATQTDVASQKTLMAMFPDETPEATSTSTLMAALQQSAHSGRVPPQDRSAPPRTGRVTTWTPSACP